MKNLIEITKYSLIALAILIVGFQLAAIARSYSRNQAIDGCYQASAYQANFPENGRNITVTETQKHIFEQCLAIKNIILEPLE